MSQMRHHSSFGNPLGASAVLRRLARPARSKPYRTPRAASVLTARGEALRDFTGRSEGQKVGWLAAPAARNAAADRRRQREPPAFAFCPSDLPVKILDRAKWPGFATKASAIQAAAWQPKMRPILRRLLPSCDFAARRARKITSAARSAWFRSARTPKDRTA